MSGWEELRVYSAWPFEICMKNVTTDFVDVNQPWVQGNRVSFALFAPVESSWWQRAAFVAHWGLHGACGTCGFGCGDERMNIVLRGSRGGEIRNIEIGREESVALGLV